MPSFVVGNRTIGTSENPCFIIAEIGQNHQGSIEEAKRLILEAKNAGCDCVKFQKSCLSAKFTAAALAREYSGPNSWGTTYGEHKSYLEFSITEMKELKDYADSLGILFSASAMDQISFDELLTLNLPFIKIGSGDANNFRLLQFAAKQNVPLIVSTGMQNLSTVDEIVSIMKEHHKHNYALLHCVSAYPTQAKDLCLQLIRFYKKRYANTVIGYSSHEQGILPTLAAVLLGARVIERHFTLDKTQKGSDHKCSLDPNELTSLVRFIRDFETRKLTFTTDTTQAIIKSIKNICGPQNSKQKNFLEMALRDVNTKTILDSEMDCRRKLGKSLVYNRNLPKGHALSDSDLVVKVSEPLGITAELFSQFIGKVLYRDASYDDPVCMDDFV